MWFSLKLRRSYSIDPYGTFFNLFIIMDGNLICRRVNSLESEDLVFVPFYFLFVGFYAKPQNNSVHKIEITDDQRCI